MLNFGLAGEKPRSDVFQAAVYDYIARDDPSLTPEERQQVLEDHLVQEVTGWPFQERIKNHRLYAYQRGSSTHAFTLVSVDAKQFVSPLSDQSAFNVLLREEGILIKNDEDAEGFAQLFLTCYFVTQVVDFRWELGVNVVRSVDDISFRNRSEKKQLAKVLDIRPPELTREGSLYHYVVYGWEKIGTGSVFRYRVVLDAKGITGYKRTKIKADIGRYENLM
jgi:hypothetical protein